MVNELGLPVDPALILEAAAESMLITTADLTPPGPTIVYVNPAFERMTGWRREEILGQTPRVLQGPETDRTIFSHLETVLAKGEPWNGQAVNYRKDRSTFVMEWSIVPLADADGEVRHYLAVQRDVTARVEAERRLAEAREAEHRAEQSRKNLARYFPPRLAEDLAGRDQPLGPVRRQDLTAMFVDIVGFTNLAEATPPEQIIELLRAYHRRVGRLVFAHGGSIEAYVGDAVVAVFGVPEPSPADAANGLACAAALLDDLAVWNERRIAAGFPPIEIGIGLQHGPAVLGDVGSENHLAFTAIGDTLNSASRLQQLTRTFERQVLVGDNLVAAVRSGPAVAEAAAFLGRMTCLGEQEIRGRTNPLTVWAY